MRPVLIIRPFETKDSETKRIFDYAARTVEGFNAYTSDFIESIAITNEKMGHTGHDSERELRDRICYLNTRISELVSSMKSIAEQMPGLVEYREHAD